MKRTFTISFLTLMGLFYGFHGALAVDSSYPTKPIEMLIGFAPGAGTDLGARMIAEDAKRYLGQEIIVVNKPGAGGRAAMTLIAKAKPDGYTLAATTDVCITLAPNLEPTPYKPAEDFTYITQFGSLEVGTVVLPDSPFHTFKGLIDFARANPGKLTISTIGVGTAAHVAFEAVTLLENLKIKLVPFPGSAPAITALLGGHVMAASAGCSGYMPHLRAKKVRLLAIMSEERNEAYPEVPTFGEHGYPLVFPNFYLISGPKNMERPVVKKLEDAFRKGMESPAFIKIAKELSIWTNKTLSGDELKERILRINARNEEIFKKLGMGVK
jgi:tripartite-type tricarboxylate transporter receptor subunit TctC